MISSFSTLHLKIDQGTLFSLIAVRPVPGFSREISTHGPAP
jgi:hypothetical protein